MVFRAEEPAKDKALRLMCTVLGEQQESPRESGNARQGGGGCIGKSKEE